MPTGIIKTIVAARGFGFIERDDGGKDLFFHVRSLPPATPFDETLCERRVSFDVEETGKGLRAVRVKLEDW